VLQAARGGGRDPFFAIARAAGRNTRLERPKAAAPWLQIIKGLGRNKQAVMPSDRRRLNGMDTPRTRRLSLTGGMYGTPRW